MPTGQAQRAHGLLRISCHVMPFPLQSCMNKCRGGNPDRPQPWVDLKNNQKVMLYAPLATMK